MKQAWCDSSFDYHKKVAGFGIIIQDGEKQRTYSNWLPAPDNNYAEIFAIYETAILLGGQGIIYTDSQIALNYINKEIKNRPRNKTQYINHKRMEFIAYKIRKLGVSVCKIKAHQHKVQTHALGNNMADLLARNGRAKYYES